MHETQIEYRLQRCEDWVPAQSTLLFLRDRDKAPHCHPQYPEEFPKTDLNSVQTEVCDFDTERNFKTSCYNEVELEILLKII